MDESELERIDMDRVDQIKTLGQAVIKILSADGIDLKMAHIVLQGCLAEVEIKIQDSLKAIETKEALKEFTLPKINDVTTELKEIRDSLTHQDQELEKECRESWKRHTD